MAKDPAFLFYSSDFLAGVQDLTMEERGQYITLLCLQHQKGHLSDKIISLAVADAAADVMAKFRHDPAGLWYNVRLDEEIEKRKVHTQKQQERAINGWKKRKNDAAAQAAADAAALPLEDENENTIGIKIQKEICKIFGKDYLPPKDRLPALANWFSTIDYQAKILYDTYGEEQAISQIRAYVIHCKATDRKLIGTNYKVAETILSSDWVQLTGGPPPKPPSKYETAEERKRDWTKEAWEERYEKQLRNDNEFRKHFGYAELRSSAPVGSNGQR